LKVKISINDGEYTAHFDEAVRIIVERRAGRHRELKAVETIEDLDVWDEVPTT